MKRHQTRPIDPHWECGAIVAVNETQHAHENDDGRCWHDNDDVCGDLSIWLTQQ
jgi:hypothetical protein